MKLTRKELRKLTESVFVSSPDGTLYSPDDVRDARDTGREKDAQALGKNPKLDTLLKSDDVATRKQGRELATTLEYQPELTDIEMLAIDDLDPDLVSYGRSDDQEITKDVRDRKVHHDIIQQFKKYLSSDAALNRVKKLIAYYLKYPHPSYQSGQPISWALDLITPTSGFNLDARLEPHIFRDIGGYIKR